MKPKKRAIVIADLPRNILVGAAIGLYYGIFYNPSANDPDYAIAILLAVLAALVTAIIRARMNKLSFREFLIDLARFALLYGVGLVTLAARTQVVKLGGRAGLIAFTTLAGVALGVLMTRRTKPNPPDRRAG